jgi:thioesterase domain-containing protein
LPTFSVELSRTAPVTDDALTDDALKDLERTLHREMPISVAMGVRAVSWCDRRLAMQMPLAPNRNHQSTAFAGSLNALCTVVGWGTVYLLVKEVGLNGNIVIRRGNIRYLRPVRTPEIIAHGLPLDPAGEEFFFELLRSKGRSKIDVCAEIADAEGPLVSFSGSYVVQD